MKPLLIILPLCLLFAACTDNRARADEKAKADAAAKARADAAKKEMETLPKTFRSRDIFEKNEQAKEPPKDSSPAPTKKP